MSVLEELVNEKFETMYQTNRDRYIIMCIIQGYLNKHNNDYSIYKLLDQKNALTEAICREERWEPSFNGFVTRTDFTYDKNLKEITFTTNRIIKTEDKYISDGSDVSNRELITHLDSFIALSKLNNLIHRYYLKDQERIERNIASVDLYDRERPEIIRQRLSEYQQQIDFYINSYGSIGIDLLVKWLNKLNDPNSKVEELINEFTNDIKETKHSLNIQSDPNYVKPVIKHLEIGPILLDILAIYSPRGYLFRREYRNNLGQIKLIKV